MNTTDKAAELLRLHTDPELLVLVNVWDVASARVVADLPGCKAIATASAAIAACYGYEDGERIPLDLALDMTARIVDATDLPVSADLEAGYGDVATTIARAISVGVVGANLEDQMRPLPVAVAAVETAVHAAEREGVPLVLNARTDAFLLGATRSPVDVLADAIARARAYLDVGASCVFVPGVLDALTIAELVGALGHGKLSILGLPGTPPPEELAALGVARVSYGPYPQRLALGALAGYAGELLSDRGSPANQS
ncbi:MAG: isocitrate lyase/phosphoenolpyruvate mutase family protein [Actinomycetota bacterium]|nr:isocitrate lyase/phosphoenolpyruvate mutase family protein [Actinomycetota bacterium]MDA8073600.1 isocitrate lyase/phosphoenolpyruvate mutase family protein [Actinomycetota bacterium]